MKETEDEAKGAIQAGYRYALALTHHHFEAEDLVQEAWMRTLGTGNCPYKPCFTQVWDRFSLAVETSRQS